MLRRQQPAKGPRVLVKSAGERAKLWVRLHADKVRAVLCTYLVAGGLGDAQVGAVDLLLGNDGGAAVEKAAASAGSITRSSRATPLV
jgi:hypothetical protein